jgi:L-lactate dehydrogenase complex protein LldF
MLQQFVNRATVLRDKGRVSACREAFGEKYDEVRELASQIKQHTLDHLDQYLNQFIDAAERAGVRVHYAADAREANEAVLEIARQHHSHLCVKSKSMVTEETGLVPALEAIGVETLETDLGEFILQLEHEPPSHIVAPMIHKDRTAVARAFVRELGAPYTEDPPTLTAIARRYMRRKFREADLGISGANFLIAETGSMVLCTNEGNADLSVGVPRVHVAVVGIEKVIPRLEHLSVFLKLLARSATSQPLTVYTSIITGPRKPDAPDGPDEVHVVLLDNGRTGILREETRELLRCIRCGACLNACPVYRKAGGGHAYGAVYSGPIGATITPLLQGLHAYPDLPHASSLCGACFEACPVKIDIPSQLIRLRETMVRERLTGAGERTMMRLWAAVLRRPWAYGLSSRAARTVLRRMGEGSGARDPFTDRAWLSSAPGPLAAWTSIRDLPTPTSRSFRDWWNSRESDTRGEREA